MKPLYEIKQVLASQKSYLYDKYGIMEIGIFGSYIRGEQRPDSDLDILIELSRPAKISLFGLVQLESYLSDLLDIKVQTAIKRNLKPRLQSHILQVGQML